MNDSTTFAPRPIARFDHKRFNTIRSFYDDLAADLSLLYNQLTGLFTDFSIPELFEFIKAQNPERWLLKKYAELKADDYPEMDVAVMIGSGLLKLPTDYSESLNDLDRVLITLNMISEARFFYPIAELYQDDDGEMFFGVTDHFRQSLEKTITPTTKSQAQNEAVEALESIQTGLNALNNMKVLNFSKNGVSFLGMIGDFFRLDKHNSQQPVDIDPHVFIKTKLRRFLVNHRNGIDKYRDEVTLWTI